MAGRRWRYPAAAALLGCPVVYVPGNHEYYGGDFDVDRAGFLAAAQGPAATALDRGVAYYGVPASPARLRVLGATLWTDYAVAGVPELAMFRAMSEINDHRRIRRQHGQALFLPRDARAEHARLRAWLLERLADPHDQPRSASLSLQEEVRSAGF